MGIGKDRWEDGYNVGKFDGERLCVKIIREALKEAGLTGLAKGLTPGKIKEVLNKAFGLKGD